jgi:hypothetical protein
MIFRHNSYQSMGAPSSTDVLPPVKPTTTVHKGLQFLIFMQLLLVDILLLPIITLETSDAKTLPLAEFVYDPYARAFLVCGSLVVYFASCIGMRVLFPQAQKAWWCIRLTLFLSYVCLSLLVCFVAAYTVCDPILRFVRDPNVGQIMYSGPTHTYVSYQHPTALPGGTVFPNAADNAAVWWPLSEVPTLAPGWVMDNNCPTCSIQCAAHTAYTVSGRLMLLNTMPSVALAFIIATCIPQLFSATNDTTVQSKSLCASYPAIWTYCVIVSLLMACITTVIINDGRWDWRIVLLMLFSTIVSGYLAVSVVNLPPPPPAILTQTFLHAANPIDANKPPSLLPPKPPNTTNTLVPMGTVLRAVWLTIQPVLAVEHFLSQLDEEEDLEIQHIWAGQDTARGTFPLDTPVAGTHV